ncbi:hypothetical protein ACIQYL_21055 [Lysinibacillus xylanilyticus]|uniref:hypothetical protein n=1 Tax=Lysinibacillus xylanilyticus TaxID=582475 RepID=UPI00381E9741
MTLLNSISPAAGIHRLPIATLTFHLNTSIYRYKNGELTKCENEHIVRGSKYPLLDLVDDIAELSEGRFVKGIAHQKPTVHYGMLEVIGDGVNVCTRSGLILRQLCQGQKFNVENIMVASEGNTRIFAINKKEYISSVEQIRFIAGYLILKRNLTLVYKGKPLILEANKPYPFSEVIGMQVLLTDYTDTWVDVNGLDYKISSIVD